MAKMILDIKPDINLYNLIQIIKTICSELEIDEEKVDKKIKKHFKYK